MHRNIELAWAGGFFDGEGNTCCFAKGTSRSISISVSQVNRINLHRFMAALDGIGSISVARVAVPGRKPISKWLATGPDVRRVLKLLAPYIGEEKATQGLKALVSYAFRRAGTAFVIARGKCLRGHDLNAVGLYTDARGRRECNHCRRARRSGHLPKPSRPLAIDLRLGMREYRP